MDNGWANIAKNLMKSQKLKYCSAPEILHERCDSRIIDAHTLSKSLSLRPIASNGVVMSVNTNPFTLNEQNGVLTFTKTGISKASVFTGFCAYHDKHIFSPIENTLFYPSAENLFLQAYRISCMEYFKKSLIVKNQYKLRNEFNSQLKELKKERNYDDLKTKEKIIKSILSEKERHEKQGLSDTGKIKKKLDEIYLSKSFSRLRHKVFEVENNKVVTGASILIEIDFYNNKLQNLNDYNQDQFIIFNCISTSKDKGFIFSHGFRKIA
ncbi:hypothetical protein [Pectobacterium sp. F1-1]|uniref:hypothetical protein n=1 Tax=Pectobacterium sp. F1-1 TaxID=2949614 RepID=UPI0021D79425|nr:hypothetical protein [Pectobacterium sp. F1-1]